MKLLHFPTDSLFLVKQAAINSYMWEQKKNSVVQPFFKVTRDRKWVNLTLRYSNLDLHLQCLLIEPFCFPTHEYIHEWYINGIPVVVPHYNEALVE